VKGSGLVRNWRAETKTGRMGRRSIEVNIVLTVGRGAEDIVGGRELK
jgi:hypothetical protein